MQVRCRSRLARLFLPRRFIAVTLGSKVYTPLGSLRFAALYLGYHWKHGYEGNPFEFEARLAEPAHKIPA